MKGNRFARPRKARLCRLTSHIRIQAFPFKATFFLFSFLLRWLHSGVRGPSTTNTQGISGGCLSLGNTLRCKLARPSQRQHILVFVIGQVLIRFTICEVIINIRAKERLPCNGWNVLIWLPPNARPRGFVITPTQTVLHGKVVKDIPSVPAAPSLYHGMSLRLRPISQSHRLQEEAHLQVLKVAEAKEMLCHTAKVA